MANLHGRLDRLARLYPQPEIASEQDWRDLQRMFALINCRLSPSAQVAFHSVLNRWRLRPDDPPRLDASGYLSVEFLGELRQALAPHCDLLALATTLMENKAESEE